MDIDGEEETPQTHTIQARFVSDVGVEAGPPLDLPVNVTKQQLELILNALLKNEEQTPYLFFINDDEVRDSIQQTLGTKQLDVENVLDIVYQPQAVFRVRPVTRCTSSMPGHAEAIVSLSFSPNSLHLASGSGDTTLRLWDLTTETPHFTCTGHRNWVLSVAWSPDSLKVASADKAGEIRVWCPDTGKLLGRPLVGHKKWVSCLSWEPYHKNPECRYLASAGNDNDVRIWDVVLGTCTKTIAGHTAPVTAVRWGGSGLLYTSSRDRTIKMWRAEDGVLCKTFTGHAHWVNNLALNTDYVLRTGPFHPVMDRSKSYSMSDKTEMQKSALERYEKVCPDGVESFVSCSDDFTLYLWKSSQKQFITRMTGHQNVVNDVKYSPDVKLIASASFDKSVRLWRAGDGAFICAFRGHVQAVYTVAWSADSRLILSGSKDSTLKVWSVKERKLAQELPGHADEVFGVDWAPDGSRVASGGKDKVLKLWTY
ncbi:protein Notchless [Aedes albopictus]|uniref:NLE domain-containing protein n=2 Tax=Aedes albopictus TaxID=7160 RepID=A0ABM2A0G3_AEDAL|nr:protein Notchless [Aedes albopictus]XP_029717805.1 LOW QUALITY PROTEIN: protein Notchless [Aedes albopictus]